MAVFHPRARLGAFVEGALTPLSRARVSAHLSQCDECRDEVAQRERIRLVASSVHLAHPGPSAPAPPSSAPASVLESREGVPGWKVVTGMGVLGLAGLAVLSAAWIAGDPAALARSAAGNSPWSPASAGAAAPSEEDPEAVRADPSAAPGGGSVAPDVDGSGSDRQGAGAPPPAGSAAGHGGVGGGPGDRSSVVLFPAGVDPDAAGAGSTASLDPGDGGESTDTGTDTPGVALAGAVALTPEMVTDLREHGWNVPSLNGFGLRHDTTGWALVGDAAEVVMSLRGEESSLVLHECRSLAEDAAVPDCPLDVVPTETDAEDRASRDPDPAGQGTAAATVEVRDLPVGVEMALRDHGDGTWTATARTAQAAYSVVSDLPVERADRVMTLVVVSERSWVQSGTMPERPSDRLARGFERLIPWMSEPGSERR